LGTTGLDYFKDTRSLAKLVVKINCGDVVKRWIAKRYLCVNGWNCNSK